MSSAEIHHDHRDVSGGWLRPAVFGANDGLVSNFALMAGVAGGTSDRTAVIVAGLAGLVAGAFSMAAGEWVSVRTQAELVEAEIDVERRELHTNPEAELAELTASFVDRGVDPEIAAQVAEQLSRDPDRALQVHTLTELGTLPGAQPSPWVAAGSSLLSFSIGAFVPLLPYVFGAQTLWPAAVLASLGLFGTGALASRVTNRTWWFSGTRQLIIGTVAAAVTYGVGALVGS
jgi:VIT1/CCC1 family predicted Fe2+/Mn2+ transporter